MTPEEFKTELFRLQRAGDISGMLALADAHYERLFFEFTEPDGAEVAAWLRWATVLAAPDPRAVEKAA